MHITYHQNVQNKTIKVIDNNNSISVWYGKTLISLYGIWTA